jgi:Tol biopolymer transport system component
VFKMNADGTNPTNLTPGLGGIDGSASWSPDGSVIAFASDLSGDDQELYTMNPDGSNVQPLVLSDSYEGRPSWSPDGIMIAFAGSGPGGFDVLVANADGSGSPAAITDDPAHDGSPDWSPDGMLIAFFSRRTDPDPQNCGPCQEVIYTMDANGANVTELTDATTDQQAPNWQAFPLLFGDLNCDGAVDLQDLLISLKHAAQVEYELPAGCPALVP